MFETDSILPPPPEGAVPILHNREYRVEAYRLAADRILIQGAVRDQKPPGVYLRGDPDPLTVHHMQVSLEISFPDLVILKAHTDFEAHPHDQCATITTQYDKLVGLSIARGFARQVKELTGGPKGCTHTTALIRAMVPVALQCFWSMESMSEELADQDAPFLTALNPTEDAPSSESVQEGWQRIVNTCHIWDEDGDAVAARQAGAPPEIPVFLRPRLAKLGISTTDWIDNFKS